MDETNGRAGESERGKAEDEERDVTLEGQSDPSLPSRRIHTLIILSRVSDLHVTETVQLFRGKKGAQKANNNGKIRLITELGRQKMTKKKKKKG